MRSQIASASGARLRKLRDGLNELGLDPDELLNHVLRG
jgi:hypothetical protein